MDLAEIRQSPEKALELLMLKEAQIEQLTEELCLVLHRKFGRSSEKIDPNQKELFEEDAPSEDEPTVEDQITVPAHRRTKAGRKPSDSNI